MVAQFKTAFSHGRGGGGGIVQRCTASLKPSGDRAGKCLHIRKMLIYQFVLSDVEYAAFFFFNKLL